MLILNKSGRPLPLCIGCKDNVVYIINQIFHHFFRFFSNYDLNIIKDGAEAS